jgi:DNA sulfur modification protein DndB
MATTIPAIRGKIGNTEYFETVMSVRDLVSQVRLPSEADDWANFGIEEKMQRDPDTKRIREQIVPYLINSADRFFGSIVVLVYKGDISFESLNEMKLNLPGAYKSSGTRIGFVTIDGGILIVIDGQHRLAAMKLVYQNDPKDALQGPFINEVADDEACVVFIRYEESVKTRRIFNTINRYAKQTSRGDNIITSEDDGYAIVSRRLLSDNGPLKGQVVKGKRVEIVNWKNNTLSDRSTQLTTLSAVYDSTKLILGNSYYQSQQRPSEDELEKGIEIVSEFWNAMLTGLTPYKEALARLEDIPTMRNSEQPYSLLFKPAAQIALIRGLQAATAGNRLPLATALERANQIDWKISSDIWKGLIIKEGGAIDAGGEARNRAAQLINWLLAADVMPDDEKAIIHRTFNEAKGRDPADPSQALALPEPVPPVKAAA